MRCQFCGKRLPILRKLTDGEFCSPAHRRAFTEQQEQQALSRLLEASLGANQKKKKTLAHPDAEALTVPGAQSVPGRPYHAPAPTPAPPESPSETVGAPPGCDRFFSTPISPRGMFIMGPPIVPVAQDSELLLPDGFGKRRRPAAALPFGTAAVAIQPVAASVAVLLDDPTPEFFPRRPEPLRRPPVPRPELSLGWAPTLAVEHPYVLSRQKPRNAGTVRFVPTRLVLAGIMGDRRPERDWASSEPAIARSTSVPVAAASSDWVPARIPLSPLGGQAGVPIVNRANRLIARTNDWPSRAGIVSVLSAAYRDGGSPWLAHDTSALPAAPPVWHPARVHNPNAGHQLALGGPVACPSLIVAGRGSEWQVPPIDPLPFSVQGLCRPGVAPPVIQQIRAAGPVACLVPAAHSPESRVQVEPRREDSPVALAPIFMGSSHWMPKTGLQHRWSLQPLSWPGGGVQVLGPAFTGSHPAPAKLRVLAPNSELTPRIEWRQPPQPAGLMALPAFAPVRSVEDVTFEDLGWSPLNGGLRCPLTLRGAAPKRSARLLALPFLMVPVNAAEVCVTGDQPMVYARPVPPRTVLRPDPARMGKRGGAPDALRQLPASLAPPGMRRAWRLAPADLRWVALVIPLVILIGWYSLTPKKRNSDTPPPGGVVSETAAAPVAPPASEGLLDGYLRNFKTNISRRAAIELSDDFRSGLAAWEGEANWADGWSYDQAGFVRPGPLALLKPSLRLEDYAFEFLGKIDRRALTWVYRAQNTRNYHMGRLIVIQGGPLPQVAFVRSIVKNGRETGRHQVVLHEQVRMETLYRVRVDVNGSDFTTSVLGKIVDTYTDGSHPTGGIGFMTHRGEESRVRWVEVSHQYDTLGRFCAWLVPNELTQPAGGPVREATGPEKEKLQQVQQERKKEKNP